MPSNNAFFRIIEEIEENCSWVPIMHTKSATEAYITRTPHIEWEIHITHVATRTEI